MLKYLLSLVAFISYLQVSAQTGPTRSQLQQNNATGYNNQSGAYRKLFYIPIGRQNTTDSGAIAFENNTLLLKHDTGWVQVGGGKKINDSTIVIGNDTIKLVGRDIEWTSVTDFGAVPNDTTHDYSDNINAALASGARCILFPTGKYKIKKPLLINSNTTLFGYGAEIKRDSAIDNIVRNNADGVTGSYNATQNIAFYGLQFNGARENFAGNCTIVAIGHANNVVFQDCEFRGSGGAWHCLELNGVRDARVSGCYFHDANGQELLQLDLMNGFSLFPWFGPYDNAWCTNITINGNVFSNGTGSALGSHSGADPWEHNNIVVSNNVVKNFWGDAFNMLGYRNLTITGNTIDSCNLAINQYRTGAHRMVENWVISNNTIKRCLNNGINVFNIKGLVISNNVIDSAGLWGISVQTSRNVNITGNVIKNVGRDLVADYGALELATDTNVYVVNNTFLKDPTGYASGVYTAKITNVIGATIENNTFQTPGTTTTFNQLTGTGLKIGMNVINGAVTPGFSTKTGNYTYLATDRVLNVDATSGPITITVNPSIFNKDGLLVRKTSSDANTVTITPSSGTINGLSSITLSTQHQTALIKSDYINLDAAVSYGSIVNIATADLSANGNHTHNFHGYNQILDSIGDYYVFSRGVRFGLRQRSGLSLLANTTSPMALLSATRKADDSGDSLTTTIQAGVYNEALYLASGNSGTGKSARVDLKNGTAAYNSSTVEITADTVKVRTPITGSADTIVVMGPYDPVLKANPLLKMHRSGLTGLGQNIATASLLATGNYVQNWNHNQLKLDSVNSFFIGSTETSDFFSRKQFVEIRQQPTTYVLPYRAMAAIRAIDGVTDSLVNKIEISGLVSSLSATTSVNSGRASVGSIASNILTNLPTTSIEAGDGVFPVNLRNSSISINPTKILINANDSVTVKGVESAATGDTILSVIRTTNNEFKLRRIPYVSGSSVNTLYNSDGSIPVNRSVTLGTNILSFNSTQASSAAIAMANTGNGNALSVSSTGSAASLVVSNSGTGSGMQISSNNGTGLQVTSDNNNAVNYTINPATTNTVERVANYIRRTTGMAANNIGGSIGYQVEDDGGGVTSIAQIKYILTNASAASRTSAFTFSVLSAGTSNDRFSILGSGQHRAHAYGVNAFPTMATTYAGYDGSGNVVERLAGFRQTQTINVTANDNETTLIGTGAGSLVIPANTMAAGKTYRITLRGTLSTDASNPAQMNWRIKFGSTEVLASGNMGIGASRTNVPYDMKAEITCRSTGALGTVVAQGMVFKEDGPGAKGMAPTVTFIDTTVSNTINVTIDMTDGSAGNNVYAYILIFEEI